MLFVHRCKNGECGKDFVSDINIGRATCPHCDHETMSQAQKEITGVKAKEQGLVTAK